MEAQQALFLVILTATRALFVSEKLRVDWWRCWPCWR